LKLKQNVIEQTMLFIHVVKVDQKIKHAFIITLC